MRFDPYAADPVAYGHLHELARHLARTALDARLRSLVEVRASQINGCAFCLTMHGESARKAGVPDAVLDVLAGWRESPAFSAPERAALALTEEMVRIGDGERVSEETWGAAREHFDDATLGALLYAIALIGLWNTLNVAVAMPPRP